MRLVANTPRPPSVGTPWHTVDQYGINWGHEHLYADNVHFPGVLSDVTWNIVMSKLCPLNASDATAVA